MAPLSAAQMRYSMRHVAFAIYVTYRFLQKRYPTNGKSAAISDVELLPPDESILKKRLQKIQALEKEPGKMLRIGTSGSVQVAYKGQRFVFMALAALKQKAAAAMNIIWPGEGTTRSFGRWQEKWELRIWSFLRE